MKPTEEQIKKFWEWCGVSLKHEWTNEVHGYEITDCICERCGIADWPPDNEKKPCLLKIDLTNLFKWAVPKTETWDYLIDWAIEMVYAYVDGRTLKDPALALFWAIYKLIDPNVVATT